MSAEELFEEGYRLYLDASSPGDLEKARGLLGIAAMEGHAMAQDILGNMYEDGDGVDEDIATAAHLYSQSAEQGCPKGTFDLGMLYLDGKGVQKDGPRAFSLIKESAESRDPDHLFMLSVLYLKGIGTDKNEKEALRLLREAAGLGSAEAKANMGAMMLSGNGLPKDEPGAFGLLKEAAEDGECSAMCNLGMMYEGGIHVEKDLEVALSYYRQAADLGYCPAYYHMAVLAGEGLIDISKADPCGIIGEVADGGNPEAIAALGEAYYHGDGVPSDLDMAAQYFRAGIDLDVPSCMYNLGVMIIRGEADPEYDGEEFDLILAAADAGYGPAKELASRSGEESRCSFRRPSKRPAPGDGIRSTSFSFPAIRIRTTPTTGPPSSATGSSTTGSKPGS